MSVSGSTKSNSTSLCRYFIIFLGILIGIIAILFQYVRNDIQAILYISDLVNEKLDGTAESENLKLRVLKGNFYPVTEENFNIPMKVISGSIPNGLTGLFMRIGPNPLLSNLKRRYHWFDGHGMIHSIRLQNNESTSTTAYYSNQYINTTRYHIEKTLNRNVFLQFGEFVGFFGLLKILLFQPLLENYFKKKYGLTDWVFGQANTAMVLHNTRLYALHEGSLMFEIQWNENNTFKSVGYESMNNSINYPILAHCKVDPVKGDMVIGGYNFQPGQPTFMQGVVDQSAFKLTSFYPSSYTQPRSWSHDMIITENYIITIESSIQFNEKGLIEGRLFAFNKQHKFRLGVTPKSALSNEGIKWFEFDQPYGLVHHLSAWEEKRNGVDFIVVWTPLGHSFDITLQTRNVWFMHELTLNLMTGNTTSFCVDEVHSIEFPRMHPEFIGRKVQYGYAGKMADDAEFVGVVKYDLWSRAVDKVIHLAPGLIAGEFIPIPKPDAAGRASDGVYLGVLVYDNSLNQSEWHLYDGETMSETPVVRLTAPGVRIPYGFHGEWVSESKLLAHMHAV